MMRQLLQMLSVHSRCRYAVSAKIANDLRLFRLLPKKESILSDRLHSNLEFLRSLMGKYIEQNKSK